MLPRMWATPPCRNIDDRADSHGRLWNGAGWQAEATSSGIGACRLSIISLGIAPYLSRNVVCSQLRWRRVSPLWPTEATGERRKTTTLTAMRR